MPKKIDAQNCGFRNGILNGLTLCLPLCLYSYKTVGMKIFFIAFLVIIIMALHKGYSSGNAWVATQKIKKMYAEEYNKEKTEKLLILREAGYGGH